MRKPSLSEFKRWSKQHRVLALAVVAAKAFAQAERERVYAYINPLFAEYRFTCKHTGKPIADVDHIYLSDDEVLCRDFFDAADHAHRQHGFTGKKDYWPNLISDNILIKAESALIAAGCKFMNIDNQVYGELRQKLLDTLLCACLHKDNKC